MAEAFGMVGAGIASIARLMADDTEVLVGRSRTDLEIIVFTSVTVGTEEVLAEACTSSYEARRKTPLAAVEASFTFSAIRLSTNVCPAVRVR